MGAAREKVRVARALTELPKVSAAFASGQLSYSKARAMTRVANTDNEVYLLMIAEHGSASHVKKNGLFMLRGRTQRRARTGTKGSEGERPGLACASRTTLFLG